LRGRVVNSEGKPLAGVSVFATTNDAAAYGTLPALGAEAGESTTSDLSGSFAIGDLPMATYTVYAEDADENQSPYVQATPQSTPLTLTVESPPVPASGR
jgi:hypothetical protein